MAFSEAEMVELAEKWVDAIAEKMTEEAAHLRLQDYIRDMLRQETLPTMAVVNSARSGNRDADLALRKRAAEAIDHDEIMSAQLKTFAIETLLNGNRPPGHRPGAKNVADLYVRDIGLAIMVAMAVLHWQLRPTRNRASTRPSASTIVAQALRRRGLQLTEWQVERIYQQHNSVAARLSATIPLN